MPALSMLPTDMPKLNRWSRSRKFTATAVLSVIGIALFYQLTLRAGHDWGGDFAQYLQSARNVAEGRPFAETSRVVDPEVEAIAPPSYPPLFSLLLAPSFAWRRGLDWALLKGTVVVSFALFLLSAFALLRRRLGDGRALVVLWLMGLSPFFWQMKDQVLSDMTFAFLAYLALDLAERAYDERRTWRFRLGLTAATGLAVYLATATRTVGVSLILALLFFELIRTRRLPVQALAIAALVVGLKAVQRWLLGPTGGYLRSWQFEPLGIVLRALAYPVELKYLFWNGYVNGIAVAVALIVAGLAIYGYIACVRRGITLAEVFVVTYMVPLVAWQSTPQIRYLIPLIPLYLYYAISGLDQLARRVSMRLAVRGAIALGLLVAASYGAGFTQVEYGRLREGALAPGSLALYDFVRSHARPDDHYIFFKPRVLAFFTGVHTSTEFYPDRSDEVWDYFTRVSATHVIGRVGDARFEAFVAANGGTLVSVFESSDFKIYRIKARGNDSADRTRDDAGPGEADPQPQGS